MKSRDFSQHARCSICKNLGEVDLHLTHTMKLLAICALSALLSLASAAHDLSSYPFSATLLDKGEDSYELFWSFDRDLKNITFAVRVNTTGWVGFGLSPNGEMTNSDLVLGWVDADDNKRGYLNVSLCFFLAVADYQNTA